MPDCEEEIIMKKFLTICGAGLFVAGFATATGIDQNPIQAVYCAVLIFGALVCFRAVERLQAAQNRKATMRPRKWEDAA